MIARFSFWICRASFLEPRKAKAGEWFLRAFCTLEVLHPRVGTVKACKSGLGQLVGNVGGVALMPNGIHQ